MDVINILGEQHVFSAIELRMEVVQSNKSGLVQDVMKVSLDIKIDVSNVMLERMVRG